MFSAVLTDGENPRLASLERCNKQNLGGCSICINTLPVLSPRAREPRTVPSLHTSLLPFPPVTFPCRQTRTPWDGKPISTPFPSNTTPRNPTSLSHSFFPLSKYTVSTTVIDLFFVWVVSLSRALIVPHSISQCCLHSGDFLLWITPVETDVTLKRMSVSFKPKEEGKCSLKVLSFMPLIDRRLSECFFSFFFFFDQSLQRSGWAWMHQALESENGVLQVKGKRALWQGCVVCLWCSLVWHRELTLTGSFIQTHSKSPGTERLKDNYIQPSWSNDARAPENIYILNFPWPVTVWVVIQN